MEPIILASASPRRQEYFRLLGLPFTVIPAEIDEKAVRAENAQTLAEKTALAKVEDVVRRTRDDKPLWIFGADTIVVIEDGVFGKAADREEAGRMLARLSGKTHIVFTAMVLYSGCTEETFRRTVSCEVLFAPLSEAEIEWYLDTEEWRGAAGSYRLQGRGGCFIRSVSGPPSNAAGLPLQEFYEILRDNGYPYGP